MYRVFTHRPGLKAVLAIAFVAAIPLAAACGGGSSSSTKPTIQSQPAGASPTTYTAASPSAATSPAASATTAPASPTAAASPTASGPVQVKMTAKDEKFNTNEIDVPAGATIDISLDNEDTGFHNIGFYTAKDTKTAIGAAMDLFKGPNVTKTITITAPTTPGTYYFQCDVHPDTMNGTFVVK
ncbi:MAG: cupredoxin domain-containing protein [Tepidiformaceae bacterium]